MKTLGRSPQAKVVAPPRGPRIYASFSARYFVVQRGYDLALFRTVDLMWQKRITGLQSVCFISAFGDVFYRTNAGLFKKPALVGAPEVQVTWEETLTASVDRLVEMSPIRINEVGDTCAAHIVNAVPPAKKAWKNWLAFPSAEKRRNVLHTICTMSDPKMPPRILFSKSLSPQTKFFWDISPTFNFIIIATTDGKGGYDVSLLRSEDLAEIGSFHLKPCGVMRVQVRDNGRAIITVRQSAKETILIIRDLDGKSTSLSVPSNVDIFHIWDSYICLREKKELVVRHFGGEECCRADITPLEKLGGSFAFFFNHKNDLALASLNQGRFQFVPIEPLNLANYGRRWQKLLTYKEESESAQVTEQQQQAIRAEEKREAFENRRGQLTNSLEELVSQRLRKELAERTRLGAVTMAQVNKAVSCALQIVTKHGKEQAPVPEYLEITQSKKNSVATTPTKNKLELQLPPAPEKSAVDPIVTQIMQLCERMQAGQISQEEYTLQLSFLSAKLVHNRTRK